MPTVSEEYEARIKAAREEILEYEKVYDNARIAPADEVYAHFREIVDALVEAGKLYEEIILLSEVVVSLNRQLSQAKTEKYREAFMWAVGSHVELIDYLRKLTKAYVGRPN